MTRGIASRSSAQTGTDRELLRVDDIEVIYDGAILAVSGVSLEVPVGGITALLGANGAGKSTTLKAISGLLGVDRARISRGRIRFGGVFTGQIPPDQLVRAGIVHVLEGRQVFAHLTVEENLQSGGFVRRPDRASLQRGLDRVYSWFPRLEQKRGLQAGFISGGEQQMLALGRALMTHPRLVLLDEPSMGLAPLVVEEIFEIVSRLNQEEGVSFLVAEQNTAMALRHAHYAYVLETGRLVLQGTAQELSSVPGLRDAYLGRQQTGRPAATSSRVENPSIPTKALLKTDP